MGETKQASVGSLTRGNYIVIEGVACKITGTSTSRPGKHGHAKVRLEASGLPLNHSSSPSTIRFGSHLRSFRIRLSNSTPFYQT